MITPGIPGSATRRLFLPEGRILNVDDPEYIFRLLRDSLLVSVETGSRWNTVFVGSGWADIWVAGSTAGTGGTINSSASVWAEIPHLFTGAYPDYRGGADWSKKSYICFTLGLFPGASTQLLSRFQVKHVSTVGEFVSFGIGVECRGNALYGKSFGTVLGEVNLGTTFLTGGERKRVAIVHDPTTSKIEWWVGGVLKGTQTDPTKIPSGSLSSSLYLVNSIENQADALNLYQLVGALLIGRV